MADLDDNPMQWAQGYVVFDAVTGAPMVFKISDPDTGLNIEKAALVSKTYEACRAQVRAVFGESVQDPKYPDRFPVQAMVFDGLNNCGPMITMLKAQLDIEALYDGERVWWVRELAS